MMKIIKIIISILLFTITRCDNGVVPTPSKTAGEITLDIDENGNSAFAFFFSAGGLIDYPDPGGIIPDIILKLEKNDPGSAGSLYFSSGQTGKASFALMGEYGDKQYAEDYFILLEEAPDYGYEYRAIPLNQYQVWAVKTANYNYGKILIKRAVHGGGILKSVYGEVPFRWIYQPNASRIF